VTTGVPTIGSGDLQVIVVPDVAGCARHIGVAGDQRKADRRGRVICAEGRPGPRVKRDVAALAIRCREVRGIGRVRRIGGALPVFQVAGLAVCRKPVENSGGRLLVTVFAKHRRVLSQQRETILVILYLSDGDIPTLDGMALLAVWPHLPLVHIGVAIRAVLPNVGEHRFHVTQNAVHLFVHASQWILRLVVVEFENRADALPTCSGVTVFTRNRDRAMRIARFTLLLRGATGRNRTRA